MIQMNTATKTTGHKAKIDYFTSNHSRYFWGAESYQRATEWVAKQIAAAEAAGYKSKVTISELTV
jgi:hypothetical protein